MIYTIFGFLIGFLIIWVVMQSRDIKRIHKAISFIQKEIARKETIEEFKNLKDESEDEEYLRELIEDEKYLRELIED